MRGATWGILGSSQSTRCYREASAPPGRRKTNLVGFPTTTGALRFTRRDASALDLVLGTAGVVQPLSVSAAACGANRRASFVS